MPSGPCVFCGATNYNLSFGGPTICPACDCGIPPEVTRQKRKYDTQIREYESQLRHLHTVIAKFLIPFEGLLIDAESKKWIAPKLWEEIESAVKMAREEYSDSYCLLHTDTRLEWLDNDPQGRLCRCPKCDA